MPQGFHRRLPNHVEDKVWEVFALPPSEQSARVAWLCRKNPLLASTIRRLVLMIEQSGVARSPLLSRKDAGRFVDDPRERFGCRAEKCRLVAEFLWRVLERVSDDVSAVGNSNSVRHAAKMVLEIDLRERPAAVTLLREQFAGSPWLRS
jgi:hypothetical protein